MAQASKGGQVGMNGETYKGGQFLPSTTLPKRGSMNRTAATRKQEIAPYTWEAPTTEGAISLYRKIAGTVGKVVDGTMIYVGTAQILNYLNMSEGEARDLITRWNSGERWV